MADGRHAVISDDGRVFGLHSSPRSAQQQLAEYFGSQQKARDMQEREAQAFQKAQGKAVAAKPQPHAPTPADLKAGMEFGAALIHQHPLASPEQLRQYAHQMVAQHQAAGDQAKMQAQNALAAHNQMQEQPGMRMPFQGQPGEIRPAPMGGGLHMPQMPQHGEPPAPAPMAGGPQMPGGMPQHPLGGIQRQPYGGLHPELLQQQAAMQRMFQGKLQPQRPTASAVG